MSSTPDLALYLALRCSLDQSIVMVFARGQLTNMPGSSDPLLATAKKLRKHEAQAKQHGKQCAAPVPIMQFLITLIHIDIVASSPIPNFTPDFAVDYLCPVICMLNVY